MIIEHWQNRSLEDLSEIIDGVFYKEEWRIIDGFKNRYSVSSFGRVKSLFDSAGRPREYLLTQGIDKDGYCKVRFCYNSHSKNILVHRLVGQYFVQNPLNKKQINHIKGNKKDNFFTRLEWVTNKENQDHLRNVLGKKCGNYSLTEEDVLTIFNSGNSQVELALEYNVTQSAIFGIKSGKAWSKITKKKYEKTIRRALTPAVVLEIFKSEKSQAELIKTYNLTSCAVSGIKTGRNWSKATGKYLCKKK